jgi:hypothetical protein
LCGLSAISRTAQVTGLVFVFKAHTHGAIIPFVTLLIISCRVQLLWMESCQPMQNASDIIGYWQNSLRNVSGWKRGSTTEAEDRSKAVAERTRLFADHGNVYPWRLGGKTVLSTACCYCSRLKSIPLSSTTHATIIYYHYFDFRWSPYRDDDDDDDDDPLEAIPHNCSYGRDFLIRAPVFAFIADRTANYEFFYRRLSKTIA